VRLGDDPGCFASWSRLLESHSRCTTYGRAVREPFVRSGWSLTVCPDAGEAGGCFVPKYRRTPSRGGFPDEARSREEAARRARGRLGRYCAANRLNRLGTPTYAPPFCTDPAELRSDLGHSFRELRSVIWGKPFPYVWEPEHHADGERFNGHFAVGSTSPGGRFEAPGGAARGDGPDRASSGRF
jgi:hypothetical protein